MSYDVAFRHQQALDPSALTTLQTTLHAIDAAITDCRNAGKDIEADPAVMLLARHLGAIAAEGRPSSVELRCHCLDQIAELRRKPALLVLAYRGVSYDAPAKRLFHADGRKALRRLVDALGLSEGSYSIRSNPGGVATSGEITLDGDQIYIQLSLDSRGHDAQVLYRSVDGRRGSRLNRWASIRDLLAPDRFAERLRRELGLADATGQCVRLFAQGRRRHDVRLARSECAC